MAVSMISTGEIFASSVAGGALPASFPVRPSERTEHEIKVYKVFVRNIGEGIVSDMDSVFRLKIMGKAVKTSIFCNKDCVRGRVFRIYCGGGYRNLFFTEIANQLMHAFQLRDRDIFHKLPAKPDVVIFFFCCHDIAFGELFSSFSSFSVFS